MDGAVCAAHRAHRARGLRGHAALVRLEVPRVPPSCLGALSRDDAVVPLCFRGVAACVANGGHGDPTTPSARIYDWLRHPRCVLVGDLRLPDIRQSGTWTTIDARLAAHLLAR